MAKEKISADQLISVVLIDYVNVVVHVFQKHIREYYDIESLWGDAKTTVIENIVKNTRVAKVYLTKDAQAKEIHKGSKPSTFINTGARLPNYRFEFGDLQNFENQLNENTKDLATKPIVTFDTETNDWGNLLMGILPFILLIGVWIFIMRRMSGAKAVAGEAKVPFFSLSGSDFVEMFVGVGASRVRDLFKQAKEKSPSIIFIDEIDAIGRARGKNAMSGSNDERENTLNQLLTEMDGFGTNTNVIVIAATNRADILDKALMRAGRFDRQIFVDLPNLTERKAIFEVHLRPLKKADGLDVDFLSKQTPGFSGADIANLCNEAALIAARTNKKAVEKQDFLDAVDRIIGGLEKRSNLFSVEEKKTIAYHEAGHAIVSWFLEHADPLVKVTIVPRGRSLGAAWYLPQEAYITRTNKFLDEICVTMGGRASEQIMFNEISTGALSDLESVTKKAKAMVMIYGLNEKVGNITYYDPAGENGFVKPYSEKTAELIDNEIKNIIETQFDRAVELLSSKRDLLDKLAARLIEREVIFKDDLEELLGPSPFKKKTSKIETKDEEE